MVKQGGLLGIFVRKGLILGNRKVGAGFKDFLFLPLLGEISNMI